MNGVVVQSIPVGALPPNFSQVLINYDTSIDFQENQFVIPKTEQWRITYSNSSGVPQPPVLSDDITFHNPFVANNSTILAPDGLDLHGTVFNDADVNSTFGLTEVGVAGVEVKLYADTGTIDGEFDAGDVELATTTTDAAGEYHFTGLARGDYIVQVTPVNFNAGNALAGRVSSPGAGID